MSSSLTVICLFLVVILLAANIHILKKELDKAKTEFSLVQPSNLSAPCGEVLPPPVN